MAVDALLRATESIAFEFSQAAAFTHFFERQDFKRIWTSRCDWPHFHTESPPLPYPPKLICILKKIINFLKFFLISFFFLVFRSLHPHPHSICVRHVSVYKIADENFDLIK